MYYNSGKVFTIKILFSPRVHYVLEVTNGRVTDPQTCNSKNKPKHNFIDDRKTIKDYGKVTLWHPFDPTERSLWCELSTTASTTSRPQVPTSRNTSVAFSTIEYFIWYTYIFTATSMVRREASKADRICQDSMRTFSNDSAWASNRCFIDPISSRRSLTWAPKPSL